MSQPTARPDALTRQAELAEHALAAPDPSADVLAGRVADYVSVVRAVRLASPDTRARLTASANDAVAVLDWFDAGAPAVYAGDDDTWRADITGQLAAALRALVASTPVAEATLAERLADADRAASAAWDEWQADRAAQDAAVTRLDDARRAAHAVLDRYDAAPQADVERQEWRATVGGAALAELRALLDAVEAEPIIVLLPTPDDAELPAPDETLMARLRAAADPVPPPVVQAAKDAPDLAAALGQIGAISPGIAVLASRWLRGEISLPADVMVDILHHAPAVVNPARDRVVDAVRARQARHAKDAFRGAPSHMDRTHPDGVVVGDPVPSGLDPEAHWGGRCRLRPVGPTTWGWRECDRPTGHTGQHVAVGPTAGDGSGPLAVVAVWPAGTGWVSA